MYIINSARNCISSKTKSLYIIKPTFIHTFGVMIYKSQSDLVIYTLTRDDMPSQSAWIKKSRSEERDFLAPPAGLMNQGLRLKKARLHRLGLCRNPPFCFAKGVLRAILNERRNTRQDDVLSGVSLSNMIKRKLKKSRLRRVYHQFRKELHIIKDEVFVYHQADFLYTPSV